MQQPGVFQSKLIIQSQIVFGFVISFIAFLLDHTLALSIIVGVGTCLIANALLAVVIFRDYRAQEISRLAMRFYQGEALKITVILSLFAIALVTLDNLNIPVMLGAYFATQVIPTLIAAQLGSRNPM